MGVHQGSDGAHRIPFVRCRILADSTPRRRALLRLHDRAQGPAGSAFDLLVWGTPAADRVERRLNGRQEPSVRNCSWKHVDAGFIRPFRRWGMSCRVAIIQGPSGGRLTTVVIVGIEVRLALDTASAPAVRWRPCRPAPPPLPARWSVSGRWVSRRTEGIVMATPR